MQIKNPVLTGFNPDPCILAAKGKYYLATSTFEYYPGVQIFESADLVNWKVV
ncbi:MAG: family 43 glycosylhydrolase, partial [Clostridia bacterium]|nr:family 43 glycosylhydrolase [Clostridia bacterium]